MSFFEPMPPPPPPSAREWAPPLWDRPSEGVLPAVIPVNALLHRGDAVAIELDVLRVYPNGFTINLFILMNPHQGQESIGRLMRGGDPMQRFPRIGLRFADGRTVGRGANEPMFGPGDVAKDDQGIPTEPVMRMTGGGGGSNGFHFGVWVFPLPPEGPVEIFVALPGADVNEVKTTVDGAQIRAAAEQAQTIWS